MEENNKKLSEKTENENKSEVKINMFENNLNTFSEGEQMNRDYLVHLYNEDMSFLNREIRMTRSGYIKMYSDIESSYQNRKKETTKQLIPMVIMRLRLQFFCERYQRNSLDLRICGCSEIQEKWQLI